MRIVLQQKESGLYFKDVGAWAAVSSEAMDFTSSTTATEFCELNHLHDMQLVLIFDDVDYHIVLQMPPPVHGSADSPHKRVRV